jgi:hypothetical protein
MIFAEVMHVVTIQVFGLKGTVVSFMNCFSVYDKYFLHFTYSDTNA